MSLINYYDEYEDGRITVHLVYDTKLAKMTEVVVEDWNGNEPRKADLYAELSTYRFMESLFLDGRVESNGS